MTETDTPRVWVGCLACYNNGDLIGQWVDAIEAGDLTSKDLHTGTHLPDVTYDGDMAYVGGELYGPHEELWVMDFENFSGFLTGECNPCTAQEIAEKMAEIDSEGHELAAVAAYMENYGLTISELDVEDFQSAYCGEHDSMRDFAMQWADDSGAFSEYSRTSGPYGQTETVDPSDIWPFNCIDWDAAARNLEGFWTAKTASYTVYVFMDR